MSAYHERFLRLNYPQTPEGLVVPEMVELTPEQFIRALYSDTLSWLQDQGGEVKRTYGIRQSGSKQDGKRQDRGRVVTIPGWDKLSKKIGDAALPIELEQGTILQNGEFTYALALGVRHTHPSPNLDVPGLSFQAGFNIYEDKPFNFQCLKDLTSRRGNKRRLVDFRVIDWPLINVSGWANSCRNGGEDLRDSFESPLRGVDGFESSMDLIKRTLEPGPLIRISQ